MGANSPPNTYSIATALTSPIFGKAFAKGCGGKLSSNPRELMDGDVAMFGHPQLMPLLHEAQTQGRNWYYGDKAYFGRNVYYRVTKNAYMHNAVGEPNYSRLHRLGLTFQPWQNGGDILVCPQSDEFFRLHGTTQDDWVADVVQKLLQHTDRTIRFQHKAIQSTESRFKRSLKDVWAVVVHSSMAGVQAAVNGVPCFATDSSCTAASFGSTDLSQIESPTKPDNRQEMTAVLAANQWTISEINSGLAWERLQ